MDLTNLYVYTPVWEKILGCLTPYEITKLWNAIRYIPTDREQRIYAHPSEVPTKGMSTLFLCCQLCSEMIMIEYIPGTLELDYIQSIEKADNYNPRSYFHLTICRSHRRSSQCSNIHTGLVVKSDAYIGAKNISRYAIKLASYKEYNLQYSYDIAYSKDMDSILDSFSTRYIIRSIDSSRSSEASYLLESGLSSSFVFRLRY